MLRLLFGKTVLRQPDADFLLQRGAASRRIDHSCNRQAVDLLAHSREHQHQRVHDEARRHTRAQDGNTVFFGHFIEPAGFIGVAVVRIEQFFSRGDNIDTSLHQGVQGRQNFGKGGDGGHQGDVNVVVLLKIQKISAHRNPKPVIDLDNFAEISSLLGWVNVKSCGNLPAGLREQQPGNRLTYGAQADLHHLHRVHSQRQPSPRTLPPSVGDRRVLRRQLMFRKR